MQVSSEGSEEEEGSWTSHPYVAGLAKLYGPEDLASRAAKASWLVCLPQPASIQSRGDGEVVLSPDVLKSHILIRSPYFKNGYQTIHGKNVRFATDGSIVTITKPGLEGIGFSEARSVKVLHDETVYDADCRSFRLLHLQQPLEGPSQLQPIFEDMYDEDRPFSSWLQQLHGLQSETGLISLNEQCKSFNEDFAKANPANAAVVTKFRDAASEAAHQLMFGGAFAAAGHGYRQYVLETALQSYMHHRVYTNLWSRMRAKTADVDKALHTRLRQLVRRPEHARKLLGLPEGRLPDAPSVVRILARLDACASPLAKVDCLNDALGAVCQLPAASHDDPGSPGLVAIPDKPPPAVLPFRTSSSSRRSPGGRLGHAAKSSMSSDELLPMLMWSIIRTAAAGKKVVISWHANLEYLDAFLGTAEGRRGFCITTLHASVTFLTNAEPPPPRRRASIATAASIRGAPDATAGTGGPGDAGASSGGAGGTKSRGTRQQHTHRRGRSGRRSSMMPRVPARGSGHRIGCGEGGGGGGDSRSGCGGGSGGGSGSGDVGGTWGRSSRSSASTTGTRHGHAVRWDIAGDQPPRRGAGHRGETALGKESGRKSGSGGQGDSESRGGGGSGVAANGGGGDTDGARRSRSVVGAATRDSAGDSAGAGVGAGAGAGGSAGAVRTDDAPRGAAGGSRVDWQRRRRDDHDYYDAENPPGVESGGPGEFSW